MRLFRDVHDLGDGDLHAVRQLVLGDASDRFGIAELLGLKLIQRLQGVERLAPAGPIEAVRVRQKQHRIAGRAALDPLVDRRQEPAPPDTLAGIGRLATAGQDHEPRQVFVVRTETVRGPRAERRTAEQVRSRVQKQLRRCVVELLGLHRLHDGDVIDNLGQELPDLAQFGSGLSVLRKGERRAEHVRHPLDEGEPLPFEVLLRTRLAVVLLQRRLVVEQVQLRGTPRHVQVDHMLGLGGKLRHLRRERVDSLDRRRSRHAIALKQSRQRDRSQSHARLSEEVPSRDSLQIFLLEIHGGSFCTSAVAAALPPTLRQPNLYLARPRMRRWHV